MEIRALRPSDDRSAFQSGDESLDRFFHRYAGQNQFRHYLGFATVAPRHIDIEELPEVARSRLPRYPVPALSLARLAVDTSTQSRGVGAQLLRFVATLAVKLADEVGCAGVVVDAKPGAEGFYARYGFKAFEALEGQSEARPRSTLMWLPIQAIKAAGQPPH